MRRAPLALGMTLALSLIANVILWYRAESAQDRADSNELVTVLVSSDWAYWEAKRDFESGTLRRFRIKDPSETTRERPDRQHVIIDLNEEHPSRHRSIRAFVEVYNRTMEQLIANKNAPPPRKGWKK
jgi:hypothetical protein